MTYLRMIVRELRFRWINAGLCCLAVALAAGSYTGAMRVLDGHDRRAEHLLEEKHEETRERLAVLQDEMRKAMLKLSFNLVILPRDQDLEEWYSQEFGQTTMPESYAERLADSGIVTVRHLLPCLQQRLVWPEAKRTIVLVGARGEVPNLHKPSRAPLVEAVPRGHAVLGAVLHRELGAEVGDQITFRDRQFTVHRCRTETGTTDDVSLWLHLADAQEILGKPGEINAILALECICAGAEGLARVRSEVTGLLPDTQVLEMGTRALARAEARFRVGEEVREALEAEELKQERLRDARLRYAGLFTSAVLVACAAVLALLYLWDAQQRDTEAAVFAALGLDSARIVILLTGRAVVLGLAGAVCGWAAALLIPVAAPEGMTLTQGPALQILPGAVMAGLLLALIPSVVPVAVVLRRDPAATLARET